MRHFKQPELNLIGIGDRASKNLCKVKKTSHNIYSIQQAYIPGRADKTEKLGSKSIALNVMGKPQKVLFKRNLISAVTSEYGATLLELINQKEPIVLRDSVEEVIYLIGRSKQ